MPNNINNIPEAAGRIIVAFSPLTTAARLAETSKFLAKCVTKEKINERWDEIEDLHKRNAKKRRLN